jgi:hypothetical protein
LDGGSGRHKAATYTGQHKYRINAHKHPCLEWDWNPRSQRSSGRRQLMLKGAHTRTILPRESDSARVPMRNSSVCGSPRSYVCGEFNPSPTPRRAGLASQTRTYMCPLRPCGHCDRQSNTETKLILYGKTRNRRIIRMIKAEINVSGRATIIIMASVLVLPSAGETRNLLICS